MEPYRWLVYALAAAVCAALVSICGKVGMRGLNSDLATAVRSIVQAIFVVGFAASLGLWKQIGTFNGRAGVAVTLAGIAGGLSWIFMFRALQLADVSKVGPIDKLSVPIAVLLAVLFLKERPTSINWAGIALILIGAYLVSLPAKGH